MEDHGGNVMVEQRPAADAVGAAGEKDFETVVAGDADAARPAVAEQRVDLGAVLGVGGAAQAEPVGEQAGPILAVPLPLVEAAAEAVVGAFFAVGVVQVAPVPRRQRLVLVAV